MTRQRFSVDTNLLIYSIDTDAGPGTSRRGTSPRTCRTVAGLGPCSWKTRSRQASISAWIDLRRPKSTAPMARHPFFDVPPDQITALDVEGLRLLIADLCNTDLR